jgi:hypothetical protein
MGRTKAKRRARGGGIGDQIGWIARAPRLDDMRDFLDRKLKSPPDILMTPILNRPGVISSTKACSWGAPGATQR